MSMASTRNRRIILASNVGPLRRAAQLDATLITKPLGVHNLGVVEFGVWIAAPLLSRLAGMLYFGFGSALATFLPLDGEQRAHVPTALTINEVLS